MTAWKKAQAHAAVVRCAFCKGEGTDPFGLLSPPAKCQVCGGRGKVTVMEPAAACAFCKGSGVFHAQRLVCTVCGGKGMVTVMETTEKCACCRGSGVAPGQYLPCTTCRGKGVVSGEKKTAA
ncbi:MAG: hypothetical protein HY883_06545 [Deltaproteobacteria bacterium]|nr:hypothetical protein [Deltaproteobacteria bacterium]